MGRRQIHTDAHLIDVAALVIARDGLAALTLEAVAADAGVSPATLSKRFGSKNRLIRAVADRGARTVEDVFATVTGREDPTLPEVPPLSALETALVRLAARDRVSQALACALVANPRDDADGKLPGRIYLRTARLYSEVGRLVGEAIRRGELLPLARTRAADEIIIAYQGVLFGWSLGRRDPLPAAIRRNVRAVLRRYAAATPTGKRRRMS